MKLLILFPSAKRGGAEEAALKFASAAAQRGWQVHAAFPGEASLIRDFQAQRIEYHRLEAANASARQTKQTIRYLPQFSQTLALLLKIKPDVAQIILPWPDKCFGSILACAMLKVPTAVRFALFPFRLSFPPAILKAYAWARARNQQWVAISENNKKFVCESFEIPQEQVLRIYNGTKIKSPLIDSPAEETVKLRRQVRQELGLSEDSQLLLTVGRLESQKGYADLVAVVASVVEEFVGVKFVWVGEGGQREYLTKKIKELDIEDSVLLLGYRSDVPRLLSAADLFVFPTRYEGGQSFALAEAMACGVPIVTSDASGIPEIVEDKVHGLMFCTGNRQELLESLQWALRHPESMQEMANNAQRRSQDFSEEKMMHEYLELWQNLSQLKASYSNRKSNA